MRIERTWLVRILACIGALAIAGVTVVIVARRPLLEWQLRRALQGSSVTVRSLRVESVQGSGVSLSGVTASAFGQDVAIEKIGVPLPNGLFGAVGDISVQGVQLRLNPTALLASTPKSTSPVDDFVIPPFGRVSIQGTAALGTGTTSPVLNFTTTVVPGSTRGSLAFQSDFKGQALAGNVIGDVSLQNAAFHTRLAALELDLATLTDWVKQVFPDLGDFGSLTGKINVTGELQRDASAFGSHATVHLSSASFANAKGNAKASGIQADVVLVDALTGKTAEHQRLVIARAEAGARVLEQTEIVFHALDSTHLHIESVTTLTLGGRISVGGFDVDLTQPKVLAPVKFEHIDLAQLMLLFPDARVRLHGRASGEVPLGFDGKKVVIGRGAIALDADVPATLQLDYPGSITGSTPQSSPAYAVLKKVEGGLLDLKVSTLRAEVYPATGELERSVALHIDAAPVDPTVKAPVSLDVNINGPVAHMIDWGLDSRIQFSTSMDTK